MRLPGAPLRRFVSALLLGFFANLVHAQDAPERASDWVSKQAVVAPHFMVVAANPLAVEAGYNVLKRGGSAIDAAIAVQMVLNLVEPQSSGIGGGGFILYHDAKTGRPVAYDGRETAPQAARPDRFLGPDGKPMQHKDAVVGGKSVGVPGTLRVLELAHRRHGKLSWSTLFAPAIKLAEEGFIVSPRLARAIAGDAYLARSNATRNYFYDRDGKPLAAGARLRNPELAVVLRRIAREGPDAFYHGAIAHDIVATIAAHPANPGDMTEEDLARYQAKVRTPVCGHYRAYRICGMPPPSSGGITVLEILGALEHFDMPALAPSSLMAVHLFSEAGRLAYADRERYLGDPDFVTVPSGLIDPAYLRRRAASIRADASMGCAQPGNPAQEASANRYADHAALEFPSTSHISIVDGFGNALAMTTTIEDGFGSRQMTHGFLLNNELTDFSFAAEENGKPVANRIEPGKRPRSSMAPTIVYDRHGKVVMITGSPGGSTIINYVAKTLIAVLDWHLDAQAAIDLPNMGSRNGPTEIEAGSALGALQTKLEALGHDVRAVEFNSGVHSIVRTERGWMGGADPRREGVARGE